MKLKKSFQKYFKWLIKHSITVFSCVVIIALGITALTYADSVTTTIGENISTNSLTSTGLTVNGNATISTTFESEIAPAISEGNWTLGTGWQSPITGGILYHNATGSGTVSPAVALSIVTGTTYKVVITTGNQMAGGEFWWFLGGVAGTRISAADTIYTDYITALTTGNLIIYPSVISMNGKIAGISVIPLTSGTGDLMSEGTLTTYRPATFGGPLHLSQGSVIYKDNIPFIHNFEVPGTYGTNTFVGKNAGNLAMTTVGNVYDSSSNVAVGEYALSSLITGYNNVAIGAYAMANTADTMASYNVAVGKSALNSNVIGQDSVAIGAGALKLQTGTGYNTAVGTYSLGKLTTGIGNTALGWFAGDGHDMVSTDERSTVDTYSMFLGHRATRDSSVPTATPLTNANAIGYMAKVGASNTMVFGGTGAYAVNVGIGTTTPAVKLDVNGIIKTQPTSSRTCDANTQGGIMYDSDDNHFYGCNGSAWVQLDN